ncbi:MAG: hypothetical protein IJU98_05720 [Synergistaceae bacterium]|nr:hypothetical protein [Synergistaceae bacterium]
MPERMPENAVGNNATGNEGYEEYLNERIMNAAAKAAAAQPNRNVERKEFMALKYTFTPTRGDMGGAFCVIFEGMTGEIVYQSLWITRPYVQKSFKPSRDWRSFTKLFPQFGPYEKLSGDKLNSLLGELFAVQDRLDLFEEGEGVSQRRLLRIEGQIRKGFERATGCFFDVACEVELLTRSELEKAKILQKPEPKEEPESEGQDSGGEESGEGGKEKSFEGTVVQCLPLVDPVRGKSASQINPGDILEVKIEGDSGPSALVQNYLETTGLAPTFPVEAIERREDKTYIYLRISEEIQGVLTLTKDLRLKAKHTEAQKQQHKHGIEDLIFFGVLGIAVIGLLLAVRFFFL